MLTQLHWQWVEKGKTIKTELKAMQFINSNSEMRKFIEETDQHWPLPKNAIWLVVHERSQYFVQIPDTKEEDDN